MVGTTCMTLKAKVRAGFGSGRVDLIGGGFQTEEGANLTLGERRTEAGGEAPVVSPAGS